MNTQKFNDSEARFIAEEIILNRLNINMLNKDKKLNHSTKFNKIKSKIESLENIWEYISEENQHTYGRKEANESIKFWSVPQMTAKVLEYLVFYSGAKNILEIGTSAGYSTIHLANATKYNNGKVHTIEILNEKAKIAKINFKETGLEKTINLLQADASIILNNWNYGLIDFVFLDADKENYGKYFEHLIPLMSKNGIIVADNINDYGHMMQDYLQKVTGTHLPKSRCDVRVISTYVAQLDNGLIITKKL